MMPKRAVVAVLFAFIPTQSALAYETVYFESLDVSRTKVAAYLFKPAETTASRSAVVLLHGRGGVYSTSAKRLCADVESVPHNRCDGSNLSGKIQCWVDRYQSAGFAVLVIDSFGSRGKPQGFAAGTMEERGEQFSPKDARVQDAYAALNYLKGRKDIRADRIALHGWSNGASTALNAVAVDNGVLPKVPSAEGFRAAVAFYPGCGALSIRMNRYEAYAPMRVFLASEDEEVKPGYCIALSRSAKSRGSDIEHVLYDGAFHNFDDPAPSVQRRGKNANATARVREAVVAFMNERLR
jgi:dienelactone hydrolase